MDLNRIREELDTIDTTIVTLLKQRMDLMPMVAAYKKEYDLPIEQLEREAKILTAKKELAREYELSEEFIESLFQLIMDEGKRIQKECNKKL